MEYICKHHQKFQVILLATSLLTLSFMLFVLLKETTSTNSQQHDQQQYNYQLPSCTVFLLWVNKLATETPQPARTMHVLSTSSLCFSFFHWHTTIAKSSDSVVYSSHALMDRTFSFPISGSTPKPSP